MPGQIEQDPGTEPESVITQGQNVIILFFLATIYIEHSTFFLSILAIHPTPIYPDSGHFNSMVNLHMTIINPFILK